MPMDQVYSFTGFPEPEIESEGRESLVSFFHEQDVISQKPEKKHHVVDYSTLHSILCVFDICPHLLNVY